MLLRVPLGLALILATFTRIGTNSAYNPHVSHASYLYSHLSTALEFLAKTVATKTAVAIATAIGVVLCPQIKTTDGNLPMISN